MLQETGNFHVEYMNVTSQHWHPNSEKFAGGDNLITALYNGWQIDGAVKVKQHWFGEMRYVNIYYFQLKRDDRTVTMPVTHSPYVNRFIVRSNIELIQEDDKKAVT